MIRTSNKQPRRFRKVSFFGALVLVIIIVLAVLELTNTTHFFHKAAAVVRAPAKPITSLPTQKASASKNGTKTPSSSPTLNNGLPTDKNGQTTSGVPTDSSKWSTSSSGLLTVKLPGANETISSGYTITGTASVNPVQYRLIDNNVGVISQGPINVVNGNFTASISFTAHSSGGLSLIHISL